jgi:hypothetical protein
MPIPLNDVVTIAVPQADPLAAQAIAPWSSRSSRPREPSWNALLEDDCRSGASTVPDCLTDGTFACAARPVCVLRAKGEWWTGSMNARPMM